SSVADGHRDDAWVQAGIDVHTRDDAAVRRRDLDVVALADPEPRGRIRMDFGAVGPDGLVDRIGQLLQPRRIRVAAVEELRGWTGEKRHPCVVMPFERN